MPAVAMTIVMPTPTITIGAAWRATLSRFVALRKCSEARLIAAIHRISAMSML